MSNARPIARGAQSALASHGPLHLRVTVSAGAVIDVDFLPLGQAPTPLPPAEGPDGPLLDDAQAQLQAYLEGKRHRFDLPLRQPGTLFQDSVWRALQAIPWGHTLTYAGLAQAIGKPDAARAVGMALGKNRLPILVPCHRVLAADGMGGFSGGLDWKAKLLELEGVRLGLG
jgi:methylated-DNA-[protein]-cysteine S-methyltransferase